MDIDEGQYPPPARRPAKPAWDERRDGYHCGMSGGCAAWLGAKSPDLSLQNRVGANPSAFIRILLPDGAPLVWPIDPKAFVK